MSYRNNNRNSNLLRKTSNRSIYTTLDFENDTTTNVQIKNSNRIKKERRAAERQQKFEQERLEKERIEKEKIEKERLLEQQRLERESTPLPLETPWDFGYMVSNRKNNWKEVIIDTVCDVYQFWDIANLSFADKQFKMNSKYPEIWLFRSGCTPTWDKAKEFAKSNELSQINLTNISETHVVDTVLACIGETVACSDHVLGIRFKPSIRNPPSIKIWVSSHKSAIKVDKFIHKNLSDRGAIDLQSEIEKK